VAIIFGACILALVILDVAMALNRIAKAIEEK